ncbi:MAG: glycosyltransferase family 4 protein [Gammaproteobacteria bacterium]|nr:glycosyltransferase family 4 protein [Gammaproteobacteria bacterium]
MSKMLTSFLAFGARKGFLRPVLNYGRKIMEEYYTNEAIHRVVAEKIAPLNLRISDTEPQRFNIFIPEIDFGSFFGGYIAKFNFARKLVEEGNRVRIITVDRCYTKREDWPAVVQKYQGIENIFDNVEVATVFGRQEQLLFHPEDVLMATTWWTAHIVNQCLPKFNDRKFLYFIQEYEAFTFPMGSYYALAHESYSFPHVALFSSSTLRDYFQARSYGVFASDDPEVAESRGLPFENAILSFDRDLNEDRRKGHKLLFYARPDGHAARNMFEIGFIALETAIRNGAFPDDWEFFGIGASHNDMQLPDGRFLKMIGKLGLKEYRERLPDFDLGLALMYTPHPSLLPIEMAAAGQVVVTNTCLNKTVAELENISSNFCVAAPTVHAVAAALEKATNRVDDLAAREFGAQVNWSQDWDQTFSPDLLGRVQQWFPVVKLEKHP